VLLKIQAFYNKHTIGKLIWACGLGKTIMSLQIVQILKSRRIAIGVPSIHLQQQIKEEIKKLYPAIDTILCIGGKKCNITTEDIRNFITCHANNVYPIFIITTYHSCYKLDTIVFDFKIGDEAHHLVGIETTTEKKRGFRYFHKISSTKTLFMTATEKVIEETDNGPCTHSMDDTAQFGHYIDNKSVQWAIEGRYITDIKVLVLKNTESEVDMIIRSLNLQTVAINKELFLAAFMTLKSMVKYSDLTHVLIYANTTTNADYVDNYVRLIVQSGMIPLPNVFHCSMHSHQTMDYIHMKKQQFSQSSHGIISCVYMFGEGYNEPKLNGTCIAENFQSPIRIAQYLLRSNRLNAEYPLKVSYTIIPYLEDNDNWDNNKTQFKKVRTIIAQLRNVDEAIEHKISVFAPVKRKIKPLPLAVALANGVNEEEDADDADWLENENTLELEKLKIRLRHSKALGTQFSEEQCEYDYARVTNIQLGIGSKHEYNECYTKYKDTNMADMATPLLSDDPERHFKTLGVWTSWYHFMGIDVTLFIQTKDEWKQFCNDEKIINLPGYYLACKKYPQLPKDPAEYYADFTSIGVELGWGKKRR
jgi:predicted helicase